MSTLYVVPTPIGNLKDITLRAKEVLCKVDTILCEDTRVMRKLLSLLRIDTSGKRLIPYFDHNEREKYKDVVNLLLNGVDIALVSDAGMPVLNDPGFLLIREIRRMQMRTELVKSSKISKGSDSVSAKRSAEDVKMPDSSSIKIEVLPGPDSITTALVASGFPADRFTFLGYLPRKPSDRQKLFKSALRSNQHIKATFIAFETKHRLLSSLQSMEKYLGKNLKIALCRELTKMHESIEIGTLREIIDIVEKGKSDLRGEIVIVFNVNV
ncbi:hypothetical protein A2982_01945 [candidate division WWE3 bacterium RIFCSPLOWO2_01_FULL_39_13]|uniref:Ribosomal RNA small subunit methyltransferase I n=1 Tax=candidate division WWE3 bacterium RIFCSPLOWO2_01_FULL_39_13 TaxID=1802624 RepID=A0A1F4V552_UNCKA|nr:MAG: hypothetical protein A2982_01945 [candidate division WWE3 bacterium RIFCSPLOWO2_01_FULL_39_13]